MEFPDKIPADQMKMWLREKQLLGEILDASIKETAAPTKNVAQLRTEDHLVTYHLLTPFSTHYMLVDAKYTGWSVLEDSDKGDVLVNPKVLKKLEGK